VAPSSTQQPQLGLSLKTLKNSPTGGETKLNDLARAPARGLASNRRLPGVLGILWVVGMGGGRIGMGEKWPKMRNSAGCRRIDGLATGSFTVASRPTGGSFWDKIWLVGTIYLSRSR